MNVGERKYPHPLITLVAVLVVALALSAIIWAETGWPWRSSSINIGEGAEEAEAPSYIEFNGVRTVLPHSEYGGATAANPFTFAITPRYLVFPDGQRFRYEIAPGKIIAWDGLPLNGLKQLNPGGNRASLYVDEYTPMVLLYHLIPQFLGTGFSGVDFLLEGPESKFKWQVDTAPDPANDGLYDNPHCLYWDRRVIQLGTPTGLITETNAEDYLFLSKGEFRKVLGDGVETVILLPGSNTTFGELVVARDVLWETGNKRPYLALGFDDPAIELFIGVMNINPGFWEYNIQPTDDFPPGSPSIN